ncbi:hypothetical protein ACM26V_20835 [Salipaludibacillus sp. HK11]|uniref:hypothetical protein n=1 Tax=Salipaludibacillus sp. HK11 TaxID=3394320 RepID=UPI0039FC20F1
MLPFIIIVVVVIALLAIYFINIGLVRVQLEELAHRYQRGDNLSGDLEEWEYYLNKLFLKPFATKKLIDTYGAKFEPFVQDNHPTYDSKVLSKYKKYVQKQNK